MNKAATSQANQAVKESVKAKAEATKESSKNREILDVVVDHVQMQDEAISALSARLDNLEQLQFRDVVNRNLQGRQTSAALTNQDPIKQAFDSAVRDSKTEKLSTITSAPSSTKEGDKSTVKADKKTVAVSPG